MGPVLTWHREPDGRGRVRYVLRSPAYPKGHFSPLCADDRLGVCAWYGPRRWRATFFLGYDSVWHQAGTPAAAMKALERELCKRSIGIFGTDDVGFKVSPSKGQRVEKLYAGGWDSNSFTRQLTPPRVTP